MMTDSQAQREAVQYNTLSLTPDEQLAFWNVLNAPHELTEAQQELGRLMKGIE